jgi:hypothetical protein
MSWQATAWVIEHSKHKGSNLLTLLCIANCANEDGSDCWPSKERLAKDTRMSSRQLNRIIDKLEASGELIVRRSPGRLANHYALPLMKPNPDKMSRLGQSPNPDILTPNPDILDANPDIAMSHDPSVRTINKNSHREMVKPKRPQTVLTPPFQSTAFLDALATYKASRTRKLKPESELLLYDDLISWGEAEAIFALRGAAKAGHLQVLHPSKYRNGNLSNGNGYSREISDLMSRQAEIAAKMGRVYKP